MTDQQISQPEPEVSDEQLINGDHLLQEATDSFMGEDLVEAPPPQQEEHAEVAGTPENPEFPEEKEDSPRLSRAEVELERREAELRYMERELALREQELLEEEEAPLSFRESPKEAFLRIAQENGMTLEQAYDSLTRNILGENDEELESERLESRFQTADEKIAQLEQRLQDQAFEQEENELYDGLYDMVEDMQEKFPIAASRGETTVNEIFDHIVKVANETGEVLDAYELLEQYEEVLHKQIQELSQNDAVRQLLGLAAKQSQEPVDRYAHEVARGTPTLTNRSAGERSVLNTADELPDDDEIIRLASEAFIGR